MVPQLMIPVFIGVALCVCPDHVTSALLDFRSDGDVMKLTVGGKLWLVSEPPAITAGGRRYRASDGSLRLVRESAAEGRDTHGPWRGMDHYYMGGTTAFQTRTQVYLHPGDLSPTGMIVCVQYFPDGANGTSLGNPNYVTSAYPRFRLGSQESGVDLGYLNYGGMMVGDTTKWMGRWNNHTANLRDGVAGGPIALFDKTGHVVIVSPFNHFMASVSEHEDLIGGTLSWGIMGSVLSIPAGFAYKTIISIADGGINQGFEMWGARLRKEYNRHDEFVKSDFAVNYLGYWTDNGAYYYFLTEKGKTYEETIFDVQEYARKEHIPYRYVQYDSWWYYQDYTAGVTKWEARPQIFPHGMAYVYNKTGWPVVAHNRWWSSKTPYAKKNGGKYDFIVEPLKSAPMDKKFWEDLFIASKKWGLITYEQDWLTAEFLGIKAFLTDVTSARTWLMLMGEAAAKTGLTVQYCMAWSRHALQALELPAVTQARVSDDYSPGKDDWRIGLSSIFAHALRLAPYKDSFWTTVDQPGNPYGLRETHPALHAVASTLSTGPVGPADGIGMTNVSLLMRCCNAEGLILKPNKPVTAIDSQIIQAAFRDGSGPDGEVWSTYSRVSGLEFGLVLAADISPDDRFKLTPESAGFLTSANESLVIFPDNPDREPRPLPFSATQPISLESCSTDNFCLLHTAPVIHIGPPKQRVVLFGELSKWVPMSSKRVRSISVEVDDVRITLVGAPEEKVVFWFAVDAVNTQIVCVLSPAGTSILSVKARKCYPL